MLTAGKLLFVYATVPAVGSSIARTTTATITGTGVLALSKAGTLVVTAIAGGTNTGALNKTGTPLAVTATINGTSSAGASSPGVLLNVSATRTGIGTVGLLKTGSLTVTATVAGPGTAINRSFVTRDATTGNLILDGQRFRFAGANINGIAASDYASAYGAPVNSEGYHIASHSEIDNLLNQADNMNATVIRAYGAIMSVGRLASIQPSLGVFSTANLEPVDYALQQMSIRGMKVYFPLVDNYDYQPHGKFWYCTVNGVTPDGVASQFFSNTTIINSFKAHISFVLNHVNQYTGIKYKDDPTILAWETGNEMGVFNTGGFSWAGVGGPAWTNNISAYIKVTESAQQLVMDGCGFAPSGDDGGYLDVDLPYIDIMTHHPYFSGALQPMTNAGESAHAHGKAWVAGEWPWNGVNPGGGGIDWTIDQFIGSVEDSPFIDGDNFWQLFPTLVGVGGPTIYALHYPGDNSAMITAGNKLAAHALAMQGTAPAVPPKAETLVDTFASFDSAKWNLLAVANATGGQASLPAANPASAFVSDITYDLTNSFVIAELPQRHSSTAGGSSCALWVQRTTTPPEGDQGFGIMIEGNSTVYRNHDGGLSDISETYSAINHRWLRLRASIDAADGKGAIFWDTSDDGNHWINERILTPTFSLRNVYLILYCWNWANEATPGTALFDNFNNPPTPIPSMYPPVKRPNYGSLLVTGREES